MPNPSWRSWIGIAKDTNTTLSAAVAAAATSIPVVGTSIPASSTITFVDGVNTESRVVTAGGGTSTLTVAALTNAHPAGCYITWQLSANVGPVDYIPVTGIQVQDNQVQIKDKGLRGSAAVNFGNVAGVRQSALTISGDVFPDTFPYWVAGVLGAVDFAGGTPNTHTIALKNTTDTQPTPFSVFDYNGIDTRIYAGLKVEEVALNFDPAGLLTYSAKCQSWASGPFTPTPAVSLAYSSLAPEYGWGVQATVGGSNISYVRKASLSIKRPASVINTLALMQDPYKVWSGPATASGSLDLVFEDNTQLNNFLNNSQPSLTLLFTPVGTGANATTLQFTMTKANFETYVPNQTDAAGYVTATLNFEALANTTDANTAGTGYSPIKVTAKNAKSTGTYQ
jgi:hypothetical protein